MRPEKCPQDPFKPGWAAKTVEFSYKRMKSDGNKMSNATIEPHRLVGRFRRKRAVFYNTGNTNG